MIKFWTSAPGPLSLGAASAQGLRMADALCRALQGALMLLLFLCDVGLYAQSVREQEIAQCLPGEIGTWGDGRDRPVGKSALVFVYDHSAAPEWFSHEQVLAAVQKSASAWGACGVPNTVQVFSVDTPLPEGAVVVQWSEMNSGGNFAQADLGRGLLAMSPAMFRLLNTRNPAHDARETLQMVIAHEMGHHFGLMAHSRRCVDVTSYYNNGQGERCFTRDGNPPRPGVEYRATLPTACDIARCIQANGPKP